MIILNGCNPSDNTCTVLEKSICCKSSSKDAQVSFFPIYLQEYKLAQFHCYGRYLAKHVQRGLTLVEVAELDAEGFYKMHLMSGFDDLALATMVVSTSFPQITNDVKHRPQCLGNTVYWLADQTNCRYQWSPICLLNCLVVAMEVKDSH